MRPTAVLLTSALLLSACTGDTTGADDPRTAVDTYLAAMNENNEPALKNIVGETQRDQAKPHLNDRGGKALAVESVDITQNLSAVTR